MKIDEVLAEYGQLLRPMASAPKDGRKILAVSQEFGAILCFWESKPTKLITPCWVEEPNATGGFLDRAFVGWYDRTSFRPIDRNAVYRLMIAYADEAREVGEPLPFLEGRVAEVANDR
jgi:hypothetical protein